MHIPEYSDQAIAEPQHDFFGVDPFVRALARGIEGMHSPNGVVVALNGAWGSGKSSAINLLRYHLKAGPERESLEIVGFNPWWFRGEESLVLAFFRELHAATKPSLPKKMRKVVPKLAARLLKAGPVVGAASVAFGATGGGPIAESVMTLLSGLVEESSGETVEKLHDELSAALAKQKRRFVVLIDDIDRLSPDEALAIFRLVKSAGRLPNVIYVLAFDRLLAERAVHERFPSEGPHYLEKIIQVSFDLPSPLEEDLHLYLKSQLFAVTGEPDDRDLPDLLEVLNTILMPEVKTPRDAIRFVASLSLTWPAVDGEVYLPDFVALESYRLFRPALYRAIRANRELLCRTLGMKDRPSVTPEDLDRLFFSSTISQNDQIPMDLLRKGLILVFPGVERIWNNVIRSPNSDWVRRRRVHIHAYFPTYFRFSTPDGTVSRREINEFLSKVRMPGYVSSELRQAAKMPCRHGGTRAGALLHAMETHAQEIPDDAMEDLLRSLFEVADEIDVDADSSGAVWDGNFLQIHLIVLALLEKTDLSRRSSVLMSVSNSASFVWRVYLAYTVWNHYRKRATGEQVEEEVRLLTEEDQKTFVAEALSAICREAKHESFLAQRHLVYLLYRWRNFAEDDGLSVKLWMAARLNEDSSVIRFAEVFGEGDLSRNRVTERGINLDAIMDSAIFRERLVTLKERSTLTSTDARKVTQFLELWAFRETHPL